MTLQEFADRHPGYVAYLAARHGLRKQGRTLSPGQLQKIIRLDSQFADDLKRAGVSH